MRFASLTDGCTCDPGCYPEGSRQFCPQHGPDGLRALRVHVADGDSTDCTLAAFLRDNGGDVDGWIPGVGPGSAAALQPGQTLVVGGGAAPTVLVERLA